MVILSTFTAIFKRSLFDYMDYKHLSTDYSLKHYYYIDIQDQHRSLNQVATIILLRSMMIDDDDQ